MRSAGRLLCRLVLLSVVVAAAHTALALDKTIDRRTMSDGSGSRYFVVLCARGGSATGHAFVVWGMEDAQKAMSSQEGHGFYSKNGEAGLFGPVPGELKDEAVKKSISQISDRLIVEVDRKVYEASRTAISRWATTDYRLFGTNCISFAADVARTMGLSTPPQGSLTFPAAFLQKLIQMNGR